MSDQHQPSSDQSTEEPKPPPIDLAALTAAVERLLRRDLQIARERGRGKRRWRG